MLKNITFSADDRMIEIARKKAKQQNKTLNEVFRQFLLSYSKEADLLSSFDEFINSTKHISSGRKFSRDEFNER